MLYVFISFVFLFSEFVLDDAILDLRTQNFYINSFYFSFNLNLFVKILQVNAILSGVHYKIFV